ncbi:activating signal cointegrator 1 complex subunit 2 homolog [Haliotis rufescens]|uniref:activating signal cointegrator 1 complex subunit 2 homolog n=1 Tax=Haliotis rufescens TaxID=6454 RepID=UPI001EB08AC7|nr:activating signal cointegrator 1 complex subunit 2 homolog [Haliotis rufescens]
MSATKLRGATPSIFPYALRSQVSQTNRPPTATCKFNKMTSSEIFSRTSCNINNKITRTPQSRPPGRRPRTTPIEPESSLTTRALKTLMEDVYDLKQRYEQSRFVSKTPFHQPLQLQPWTQQQLQSWTQQQPQPWTQQQPQYGPMQQPHSWQQPQQSYPQQPQQQMFHTHLQNQIMPQQSSRQNWTPRHGQSQNNFRGQQRNCNGCGVLAYPKLNEQFILTTAASSEAIGFILGQLGDAGREQVISYGGRSLHPF